MAYVHTDPPGSLECVPEPDFGSNRDKTELEMESPREKFSDERGGLEITEAARSDEASQLDSGALDASPSAQEKHADGKTKVGKGLESIGDLTVDTLQRIASAVGGVVNAPAVVMANVGGLGLNVNSPTSSGGTPLVERVVHLEMQMTMLEEKYNSRTLATELDLSPRSHPTTPRSKEKLRTARSLLQETETKGTLVERVQILEDRITEHMESIEKALSSIQSKLAHIDTGKLKPESLAVQDAAELQESLSGEEFHDADQGSGNLEPLETLEQKSFEEAGVGSDVPGEASGTSPIPQEALVKEPSAAAPTAEPAPEDGADKIGTVLPSSEPQLASSLEEPQNALAKEPSGAVPSAKFSESAQEDAAEKSGIALAAAENSPLTSIVEKPQETLVEEPLAAAPTVEESVQGDDAGKSATVLSSSEPQLASTLEEPQGALAKEPSIAAASAKLEEPAQQDAADKTRSVLVTAEESPLTSTVEEPQNSTVGSVTEDKHVQKEAEYKSAEDVNVPAGKPEAFASYVMEPKPFERREKKKKEKKEKKEKRQDGVAEEKDKKSSFRAEEKNKKEKRQDGVGEEKERKNSLRAEEKNKQPFKHLRDRFRRAFRSNNES